ncbi:MAG: dihydrodipicolinate synthase family protein [Rubripirellula sp.]
MSSANDKPLHGVLPVVQTPFTDDEAIDVPSLHRQIDWAFETGADGIVVALVSEILRLSHDGRKELAKLVCHHVAERGYTVIGVGAESTTMAIEFAQHAENLGATAVMAIPPVATQLSSAATRNYFAAITNSISIPLIVQDASSYVGAAIDLDVYGSLLDEFGADRILFKPEASPLGPNLSRLRDATNGEAKIFEGSGGMNLVDCYRRGIVGTIPGMDLLDGIIELWSALEARDEERIYEISLPLGAIVALQLQAGLDGFLAIEKYLLTKRGILAQPTQIQPVSWQLDHETEQEVDRLFDRLQLALHRSHSKPRGTPPQGTSP